MLRIKIPITAEGWDEENEEFVPATEQVLELEHSLLSISKWESKWCKVFLSKQDKNYEETLDYIKCMTVTENVDPKVYDSLTRENFEQINSYIESPMTATFFRKEEGGKPSRELVTNELIYYWMITLNIPFECETWHLNRLLTLIKVCNVKNQPPKKRSAKDIGRDYAAINAARKKRLNTRG